MARSVEEVVQAARAIAAVHLSTYLHDPEFDLASAKAAIIEDLDEILSEFGIVKVDDVYATGDCLNVVLSVKLPPT